MIATPLTAAPAFAAPARAEAATIVYYDTSDAPTFRDRINAGAANWNAAVSNVKLQESGPGPSCTNANPNSEEASRVESLWANGFRAAAAQQTRIYEVTMPVN
jgi:snapalysin